MPRVAIYFKQVGRDNEDSNEITWNGLCYYVFYDCGDCRNYSLSIIFPLEERPFWRKWLWPVKYILYQVDNDFNIINKFMFKEATLTYEYINKHISEEPDVNFLLLKFDDKNDIESVATYRSGKNEKILY